MNKKRISAREAATTGGHEERQRSRWQSFQGSSFLLPDPGVPEPLIREEASEQSCVPELPTNYPQLRILLRDSGLSFKPRYSQADSARLFEKSTRTIRNWIRKAQVPFHLWPSGEPYFTPQDLEDILAGTARESRRGN